MKLFKMAISFGELKQYLKVFSEKIGISKLFLFLSLYTIITALDGLGIAMILPVLNMLSGENQGGESNILLKLIEYLGLSLELYAILIFIAVIFIIKAGIKCGVEIYNSYLVIDFKRKVQKQLLDEYSKMNYKFYSSRNTGHFVNIMWEQAQKFGNSFTSFTLFLSYLVSALIYIAFALLLDWRFSLLATAGGILLFMMLSSIQLLAKSYSIRLSEETSHFQKLTIQVIQGFKYLVATASMGALKNKVKESIDDLSHVQYRMGIFQSIDLSIREPYVILLMFGAIVFQVYYLDQPLAPILVALILFYRAMNTITVVVGSWQNFLLKSGGLKMVTEEFEDLKLNTEVAGLDQQVDFKNAIKFQDISFAYDEKNFVIKDVSFEIKKNSTVAFVGESGAGKTTMVDLLTLLVKPQHGQIWIDNKLSSHIDYMSWRQKIGFVTQDSVIFDDTIANNISLWKGDYQTNDKLREKVELAAERAYCTEFISELPEGYNTIIGDRGIRLSGGQKQRLSIARELFKEPELLILDEATSALDTESENYVQKSIDDLKGKLTVVIIAHRLSTIKNVDYIYVLAKGKVAECGSFDDLVERESLFRYMTELQNI